MRRKDLSDASARSGDGSLGARSASRPLSFIARLVEGLGSHEPARHIPSVLVKIAGDFPRHVRTALRFEWTDVAVELGGAIEAVSCRRARCRWCAESCRWGRCKHSAVSSNGSLSARRCHPFVRLVPDRNVRGDPASNQPAEEAAGPIGGVGQKPLRLQGETLLRSLDHRLGGFNLIIGARRRRFDIDDHCVLDIDQVIEPVAELHTLVGLRGPGRARIRPARSPSVACDRHRGLHRRGRRGTQLTARVCRSGTDQSISSGALP